MTRDEVYAAIDIARLQADEKHGAQATWVENPGVALAVLVEEVGEVATSLLDGEGLRGELIDVAQVAIKWLEQL